MCLLDFWLGPDSKKRDTCPTILRLAKLVRITALFFIWSRCWFCALNKNFSQRSCELRADGKCNFEQLLHCVKHTFTQFIKLSNNESGFFGNNIANSITLFIHIYWKNKMMMMKREKRERLKRKCSLRSTLFFILIWNHLVITMESSGKNCLTCNENWYR